MPNALLSGVGRLCSELLQIHHNGNYRHLKWWIRPNPRQQWPISTAKTIEIERKWLIYLLILYSTGIGIDDTFVMLAAWRRTSVKLPVPERMGHMMSEAAVSITITSLTDMISFWIGIISPFPSVRIFCTYSGFAVCFTFLWHITFFAGCMAISGYCEYKNLHAIFGYKVLPESVAIKGKCPLFLIQVFADVIHSFNAFVGSLRFLMTVTSSATRWPNILTQSRNSLQMSKPLETNHALPMHQRTDGRTASKQMNYRSFINRTT